MSPASHELFVPGRIEVLGKHTDYAGGRSLTCATEQGLRARVWSRADACVVLTDGSTGETIELAAPSYAPPRAGHWARYPWTVLHRMRRNFPGELRGVSVEWTSDLPRAAGLSSSSALMILTFLALDAVNGVRGRGPEGGAIETVEDLAAYLAAVESGRSFGILGGEEGVGTQGGCGDHAAILCSEEQRLKLYSYLPLWHERTLPFPEDHVFAVATSGVVARKTQEARGAYNRAAQLAAAIAVVWRSVTGGKEEHLGAILIRATGEEVRAVLRGAEHERFTAAELVRRFEAFHREHAEILPGAVDALATGDLGRFGELVDQSQQVADECLGNQVQETVFLQRVARESGAEAASAFGAGFGGSVWALVEEAEAQVFVERWRSRYLARYPERTEAAEFLITGAAGPAREPSTREERAS